MATSPRTATTRIWSSWRPSTRSRSNAGPTSPPLAAHNARLDWDLGRFGHILGIYIGHFSAYLTDIFGRQELHKLLGSNGAQYTVYKKSGPNGVLDKAASIDAIIELGVLKSAEEVESEEKLGETQAHTTPANLAAVVHEAPAGAGAAAAVAAAAQEVAKEAAAAAKAHAV